MAEKTVIDFLLELEPTAAQTKKVKVKRLSRPDAPVVLELTGPNYARVLELKRQSDDLGVAVMLEGVTSPDLRNRELMDKYKAVTPAELVQKLFLPGEIEDIAREVERLAGYRRETLEEFRKN